MKKFFLSYCLTCMLLVALTTAVHAEENYLSEKNAEPFAVNCSSISEISETLGNKNLTSSDGVVHTDLESVTSITAGSAGYYERDASTGDVHYVSPLELRGRSEEIPQYIPPELKDTDTPSLNSVIGSDTRELVTTLSGPLYNHCKIISYFPDGSAALGTGFVVGTHKIATAGHVLYDHGAGGWATRVVVYPASNGSSHPIGSYAATTFSVGGEWASSANPKDDWGLIKVGSDIGSKTGWLGRKAWNINDVVGKNVYIGGYPGDLNHASHNVNLAINARFYIAAGQIRAGWTRELPGILHNVDTEKGQSGAPLFGYENGLGYTAYAIHNYGVGQASSSYNAAVLMNDWLLNAINKF